MPNQIERMIKNRRDLHQIPELELQLPETSRFCKKELDSLSGVIIEPDGVGDSFFYFLDNGKKETLAFRTDMDALPIQENMDIPYKSRHEGRMHACGHDGHMAMMLEFARRLDEIRQELDFNILLVFQAGEESPGGAGLLIKNDCLDPFHIKAIFGIHLWPSVEKGKIAVRPGAQMSKSAEVTIEVEGKSTHVSRYEQGIDAAEISAQLLLKLYEMEKNLDPDQLRLLRFGTLNAGTACNALAAYGRLYGTLRTFDEDFFRHIQSEIEKICAEMAEKTGARIHVKYSSGYPPLLNHEELTRSLIEKLDLQQLEAPDMASEDFSFYQQKFPGTFFFLGLGSEIPLHAQNFTFDESVLINGAELYERIARLKPVDFEAIS